LVCGAPAASPPPTPALSFLDYLDTPFSNLLDYQDAFLPEKREAEHHYEHRSWTAWHRHMRLVCLAQLFLLRLQVKFKKKLPP
jgi:SRSO17 transposase